MTDPSAALQKAVFAALRGDDRLKAWFAAPARKDPATEVRVFDRVPADPQRRAGAPFPYLHIGAGDDLVQDDSDDCHDSAETTLNVHVWSRALGEIEAKELAAHVARILDAELELDGHQVISHRLIAVRGVSNPDGLTTHRVVSVAYVTSPF